MKKLLATLSLTCTLGLTACGGGDVAETTTPTEALPVEATPVVTESVEDSHYPVTITNYNYAGEEVEITFEKAPEKVVAVYQTGIETLIALGLEEHVVASYGLDEAISPQYAEGFENMNYDDSVFMPDKETVTLLEPDMVISWSSFFGDNRIGDVQPWNENGVATYITTNTRRGGHARTLENEYQDIMNIGTIFNKEAEAQAIVDEVKAEIETVLANVPEGETVRVAILEPYEGAITNYGANSLPGDMVLELGGELVLPEDGTLGKEDVIAADPDVIFVIYLPYVGGHPDSIMAEQLSYFYDDSAFDSLIAKQNDKIIPVTLVDVFACGPRAINGIKTLSEGMYQVGE